MRLFACVIALIVVGTATAEDKPAVRAVPLKDIKTVHPKNFGAPKATEFTSADALGKSALFADDTSRDTLKKQLDFAKEKLVVFAWSGSGGDRIAGALSKDGKAAEFSYRMGLTDDLRQHFHVFVVPKDAEVKIIAVR
jgi:hypothetical protein